MKVTEAKNTPLHTKVKVAMDGRTQRWLSMGARIPEADLSKKLNGHVPFSAAEITRINDLLKTEFSAE